MILDRITVETGKPIYIYIYPELSRARPPITTSELALLASDGTEDLTKTRLQLSVLVSSSYDRRMSHGGLES